MLAPSPFDGLATPPCATLLGWQLVDHDSERGWARIAFQAIPEFLNPAGFVQGGIQAAMLDDTMGPAIWVSSGGSFFSTTIDMNVSFLAPASPGKLFGEGLVLQLGKSIAFVEARLTDTEGNLLARATSSARLIPAQRLTLPPDQRDRHRKPS